MTLAYTLCVYANVIFLYMYLESVVSHHRVSFLYTCIGKQCVFFQFLSPIFSIFIIFLPIFSIMCITYVLFD